LNKGSHTTNLNYGTIEVTVAGLGATDPTNNRGYATFI
jgi:hypothetical protein